MNVTFLRRDQKQEILRKLANNNHYGPATLMQFATALEIIERVDFSLSCEIVRSHLPPESYSEFMETCVGVMNQAVHIIN